jgi:hypothetical protein
VNLENRAMYDLSRDILARREYRVCNWSGGMHFGSLLCLCFLARFPSCLLQDMVSQPPSLPSPLTDYMEGVGAHGSMQVQRGSHRKITTPATHPRLTSLIAWEKSLEDFWKHTSFCLIQG